MAERKRKIAFLPHLPVLFLILLIFGIFFAALNGILMRMGNVDNDGYNALSLGENPAALRAFWIQMKINEQITKGVRLKEMPDEWFEIPSEEAMKNSMVAVIGVFACNRLAAYFSGSGTATGMNKKSR